VFAPLALGLLLADGPPLFYWGARAAVIIVDGASRGEGTSASLQEVHAALDKGSLVLRFTFDRAVSEATVQDGAPVSGRLRATLYVDRDADRATGLDEGATDLRTGADLRVEVGVLAVGADPEEKVEARAVLMVTAAALERDGRRKTLWRGDDVQNPREVSARGEWLELRLPETLGIGAGARLILSLPERALDGRLR
jgi:hypothetical protein